jgi:DNA replication and repair protein RecF
MILNKIILQNFRNYENEEFKFKKGMNIIIGNNAQGKTNLLEGIHYLSDLKSHRVFQDINIIMKNKNKARIKAFVQNELTKSKIQIDIFENKKEIFVDENKIEKNNYYDIVNTIIFFPDDLELVKGYPEVRREYLNSQIIALNSEYKKLLIDYNKLLKTRNDWLKRKMFGEKMDIDYFNIITNHYIKRSSKIYNFKNKYINKINEIINNNYSKISDQSNLKIKYITEITNFNNIDIIETELTTLIKKNYEQEILQGKTLFGPHKDDIQFLLDEENLKNIGSQGQQRMAILAYKISELEIYKEVKQKNSILLLDDVFSELDIKKNKNLLNLLYSFEQVIITTTNTKNISFKNKDINIIKISKGKLLS